MNKEYTQICEFTYKKQKYIYLLDDDNKAFFIKKTDNEENYITLDELIELQKIFTTNNQILNFQIQNNKRKIIPKIIIGGILVTLTTNIASIFSKKDTINNQIYNQTIENTISCIKDEEDSKNIPYDIKKYMLDDKLNEDITVETYKESSFMNYIYIYDMASLDKVINEKVTFNTLRDTVRKNNNINKKYKEYLYEYIKNLEDKWPNVDIRTFNENLKTIKFIECDKYKLQLQSLSTDAFACYRKDQNIIYLLDDLDMNDPWTKQVVYHEISHSVRNGYWSKNGKDIRVQFTDSSGYGFEIEEALNSLFALSLYNEDEKDIAYQLQSNYMKTILECMNNYDLSDYINHNYTYFEKCLNENNNNDLAKKVLALIELQHKDYYNDKFKVEQKDYKPIYTYITDMYLNKYATNDMDQNDIDKLVSNLKDQVLYDVPSEYEIEEKYFDNEAYNYYQLLKENRKASKSM